eukprot:3659818-Rhodomonas_salina.2
MVPAQLQDHDATAGQKKSTDGVARHSSLKPGISAARQEPQFTDRDVCIGAMLRLGFNVVDDVTGSRQCFKTEVWEVLRAEAAEVQGAVDHTSIITAVVSSGWHSISWSVGRAKRRADKRVHSAGIRRQHQHADELTSRLSDWRRRVRATAIDAGVQSRSSTAEDEHSSIGAGVQNSSLTAYGYHNSINALCSTNDDSRCSIDAQTQS